MKKSRYVAAVIAAVWSLQGFAATSSTSVTVPIKAVSNTGVGAQLGTVEIEETPYGLVFKPDISGLSPAGKHGFHIHENASCDVAIHNNKPEAALKAGGHWDPERTNTHLGPYAPGHRGDLPALHVDADGKANNAMLAPRIKKLTDIRGRALVIHADGDNFSNIPKAGGGGARLACGVIPS